MTLPTVIEIHPELEAVTPDTFIDTLAAQTLARFTREPAGSLHGRRSLALRPCRGTGPLIPCCRCSGRASLSPVGAISVTRALASSVLARGAPPCACRERSRAPAGFGLARLRLLGPNAVELLHAGGRHREPDSSHDLPDRLESPAVRAVALRHAHARRAAHAPPSSSGARATSRRRPDARDAHRTRGRAVLFAEILAPPMNLLGPELVRDLVALIQRRGRRRRQVLVFKSADPTTSSPTST